MREITLRIKDSYYTAFLHFIRTLTYIEVEEKGIIETGQEPTPKYNFSDLSGQLEWEGDAVAEQRRLRNEW
jgi:hypothetical protein